MNRLMYIFILFVYVIPVKAQSTFERKVESISHEIEKVTEEETEILSTEVESINEKLEKKEITSVEADKQKKSASEKCAARIETRIAPLENQLRDIVKEKVQSRQMETPEPAEAPEAAEVPEAPEAPEAAEYDENYEEGDSHDKQNADNEQRHDKRKIKLDDIDWDDLDLKWSSRKNKHKKSESRTTTQFVFAIGLNNMLEDGKLSSLENNGIKGSTSRFYEWGLTWKTRLAKNSPLLQCKYGLSFTYNNLRPQNNQYYVKNGNQTVLTEHPFTLQDEPYFRMINMVVPVHLEFDFSKKRVHDEKVIIRSQKGFRLGIGGFAGINLKTKQVLCYKVDGLSTEQTTKGNYNNNNFIYGLSAYVGYRDISFYTKYDLNTMFTNNTVDQHNISFGLRFDFN
ncbi:MAG: hypothetical protein IPO92_12395 [Saprospiraceae bacterium]|nr:hypothetical protein [Saprospiraceae bacterium]